MGDASLEVDDLWLGVLDLGDAGVRRKILLLDDVHGLEQHGQALIDEGGVAPPIALYEYALAMDSGEDGGVSDM